MVTEENGNKTGKETGRKRSKHAIESTSDDDQAIGEPIEEQQADNEPKPFITGGKGGPGRGHFKDRSAEYGKSGGYSVSSGSEQGGNGDDADIDLLGAMTSAIARKGPRWFDSLLQSNPVVAAQLLSCLRKTAPADGEPGGETVNIITGGGIMHPTEDMRDIDIPVPDDLSGLDLDRAKAEIVRLRRENESILANRPSIATATALDPEAIECNACIALVDQHGRMIPKYGDCPFCGQQWRDAKEGRLTKPAPAGSGKDPTAGGFAYSEPDEDRGWVSVPDLSTESIRQATSQAGQTIGRLSRGRRGLF